MMICTVKSKLIATQELQYNLLKTMKRFNQVCNYISKFAYSEWIFGKTSLQKNFY